jgi:uncharacterized protein (DUF1330 family)
MAAYVIGAISNVTDPAGFAEYQKLAFPTVAKYGGKVIVGGTKIEVADGIGSPVGAVVLQFESLQRAKQWYNSPEYKPLVSRRKASSNSGVIFVDGS